MHSELDLEATQELQSEYSGKKLSKLSEEEAVRAVEDGVKPLALVNHKIDSDLPYLEFEFSTGHHDELNVTKRYNEIGYIYYQTDQKNNAERVRDLVIGFNNDLWGNLKVSDIFIPKNPTLDYHRELGRLLGYTEEEIREFIDKLPPIDLNE